MNNNPTRLLAMVVFVDAPDADPVTAEVAVRQALTGTRRPAKLPVTIHAHFGEHQVPVEIHAVKELNTAAMAGYLRFDPSNRAYPKEN